MEIDAPLKPKLEMFAQMVANGGDLVEAYAEAGYSPNRQNAHRMTKRDDVKARITEIQARNAVRIGVSRETISRELEDARLLALSLDQPAAAVSASMGKAKVNGLLTEKVEHTVTALTDLLKEIDGQTRGIDAPPIIDVTPGSSAPPAASLKPPA